MLQRVLIRRGFLDRYGNQVAVADLARQLAAAGAVSGGPQPLALREMALAPLQSAGRKCPECGAYALRKIDGCSHCAECHYIGSCG
jgi:ribonucleoside-diphosphate reductase alpha chain